MGETRLGALEALLFVAVEPLSVSTLAASLGESEATVNGLLAALKEEYGTGRERGFQLRNVGGGWRLYTNPRYDDVVRPFVVGDRTSKLSAAALETLAVIAYRQPVTRAQIAAIRGVNVDGVVRTLSARGLVADVGATDTGARLYGTTTAFFEAMGMDSLDDLAPLAPYLPELDELEDEGDVR
ncbi:SMC-Scp complex subunit ScpB [Neoactinobaculum massilliense]|uniref:SMC-Scp complex subunit ScpB n=1 Tax=Neoactinobaculum massilliense TaxID=2364794 RepID=UPI000F5360C5|nr:SMC-Scp complex subunit ScpB [Neoactinobaculum massilliense]